MDAPKATLMIHGISELSLLHCTLPPTKTGSQKICEPHFFIAGLLDLLLSFISLVLFSAPSNRLAENLLTHISVYCCLALSLSLSLSLSISLRFLTVLDCALVFPYCFLLLSAVLCRALLFSPGREQSRLLGLERSLERDALGR